MLERWILERSLSGDGGDWKAICVDARLGPSYVTDARTREIVFRLPAGETALREQALTGLLRAWAGEVIPQAAGRMGAELGMSNRYRRVSVRNQATRWGSCSSSGTLSFNWRLVLLPWPLHRYVILHEFGHFAHMNHSGEFWDFLHRYDPDAGRHDRALMKISPEVMELGRD